MNDYGFWLQTAAVVGLSIIAVVVLILILSRVLLSPISLKGKHVVIVGGSSGIGLAIAELALGEGAVVTILARNVKRLEEAKKKLLVASSNRDALVYTHSVDVCNSLETKAAINSSVDHFGPVDILICSQGISRPMRFEELSEEQLHEVMNTNYWGCVNSIRASLWSMKTSKHPKRIALISSQAGQVGVYGFSHYAGTKFALRGLAEGLQQELSPYNIQMTLVFPPDTDTPQLIEENKTKHPVTKILSGTSGVASPEAVAKAALQGIKAGLFTVSCNFEGFFLSLATAGMSPQPSLATAILEIMTGGILRVVALGTVASWQGSIQKWHTENDRKLGEVEKQA